MKMDSRMIRRQADRLRIGDEMHLVPAVRQLDAELRRHHSAAAIRRIACDPDLHLRRRLDSPTRRSVATNFGATRAPASRPKSKGAEDTPAPAANPATATPLPSSPARTLHRLQAAASPSASTRP